MLFDLEELKMLCSNKYDKKDLLWAMVWLYRYGLPTEIVAKIVS
jgi:hypothetical protein